MFILSRPSSPLVMKATRFHQCPRYTDHTRMTDELGFTEFPDRQSSFEFKVVLVTETLNFVTAEALKEYSAVRCIDAHSINDLAMYNYSEVNLIISQLFSKPVSTFFLFIVVARFGQQTRI